MGSVAEVTEDTTHSYTEVFERTCPYFMAMGMSYKEFWEEDPSLVIPYRRSYEIKRDLTNEWLWLLGNYIYAAHSTALANAFPPKGKKPLKYIEKPFQIRELTEEEKARETEQKKQDLIAFFDGMTAQSLKAKEKEDGNT